MAGLGAVRSRQALLGQCGHSCAKVLLFPEVTRAVFSSYLVLSLVYTLLRISVLNVTCTHWLVRGPFSPQLRGGAVDTVV